MLLSMVTVSGVANNSSNETILVGEEIGPGVYRYKNEEGIVAVVEDWGASNLIFKNINIQ